jgi:hypothetical protein
MVSEDSLSLDRYLRFLYQKKNLIKVATYYPYAKFSKTEILKDIKRIHNRIFMGKGFRSMQVMLSFRLVKTLQMPVK